jgi:hypothetical protein
MGIFTLAGGAVFAYFRPGFSYGYWILKRGSISMQPFFYALCSFGLSLFL